MRVFNLVLACLLIFGLSSCTRLTSMLSSNSTSAPSLDSQVLSQYRSGPELCVQNGRILTDNDDAFETKLDLIKQATGTIDLAYYIFSDDYSSSLLARELLAATMRGVKVRLLLDYHSHYKTLNYFRMLEHFGSQGPGSLSVRLYNRPSKNIIKDAVYMTLGCGQEYSTDKSGCSTEKFEEIEELFNDKSNDGEHNDNNNISNVNTGTSGLFLSGLYAKKPELMAMAVARGQDIDVAALKSGSTDSNPEDVAKLKELAKLYWLANYGSSLDRLVNRVKLSAAFVFYGDKVNPVYDTFSAFLPVERPKSESVSKQGLQQARNDWQFLTDFLHHKILLVDQQALVVGGRNVEDSYHMNPNPMSAKYTFMDTDVYLRLKQPSNDLTTTFDKLWQFDTMVATLQDVQLHAPNDFIVNSAHANQACEPLEDSDAEAHQTCLDKELIEQRRILPSERHTQLFDQMNLRADQYSTQYKPAKNDARTPAFTLDSTIQSGYFENLPFDKSLSQSQTERYYGARNDNEARSGKNIHALWLSALKNSCETATSETPVSVYLHNAYFFLPSNLLSAMAQMIDGRQPCANVEIIVLSNSIETTDLNVVNILSRHSLKALFDRYASHHNPAIGATLSYYEYRQHTSTDNRSLHSKVMVFGNDIFIGSANADLRSYMMDTNNGLFIRQAPELVAQYTAWLQTILNDHSRSTIKNDYYLSTNRSQILDAGDQLVDAELAKYRADRFITDPEQIVDLKTRLRNASNEVYRLSKQIIADHHGTTGEQALFNSLFKAI